MAPLSDDNIPPAGEAQRRSAQTADDDDLRRVIAEGAIALLHASASEALIPQVLARIGQAAGVSRIQIYECTRQPAGSSPLALRYEWHRPDLPPAVQIVSAREGLPMARGETATRLTRQTGELLRGRLTAMGVKSVLLTSIIIGDEWCGELEFADCERERDWSALEIDSLKLLAEMIGAAIGRARDLQEFADVSWVIENSPVILYRVDGKPPHRLTYISRGVRRYSYEPHDLLASPGLYFDLLHPDDLPILKADIAALAAHRITEVRRERRIRAADGWRSRDSWSTSANENRRRPNLPRCRSSIRSPTFPTVAPSWPSLIVPTRRRAAAARPSQSTTSISTASRTSTMCWVTRKATNC
jgi:hypothetical protein